MGDDLGRERDADLAAERARDVAVHAARDHGDQRAGAARARADRERGGAAQVGLDGREGRDGAAREREPRRRALHDGGAVARRRARVLRRGCRGRRAERQADDPREHARRPRDAVPRQGRLRPRRRAELGLHHRARPRLRARADQDHLPHSAFVVPLHSPCCFCFFFSTLFQRFPLTHTRRFLFLSLGHAWCTVDAKGWIPPTIISFAVARDKMCLGSFKAMCEDPNAK